jgi:hypothetical protein
MNAITVGAPSKKKPLHIEIVPWVIKATLLPLLGYNEYTTGLTDLDAKIGFSFSHFPGPRH